MVVVAKIGFLSDLRNQKRYREFSNEDLQEITSAVQAVPKDIFGDGVGGNEIRQMDALIAKNLPEYEFEHDGENGRNSACKLWENNGFDHSVDLYNAEKRIAIEIEKTERKRVSDDILKFIKGGKTQKNKRKRIEFGCLIVPTNYGGSGNIFGGSLRNLEFMRSVLFVEDIAVIGYKDPRWD